MVADPKVGDVYWSENGSGRLSVKVIDIKGFSVKFLALDTNKHFELPLRALQNPGCGWARNPERKDA